MENIHVCLRISLRFVSPSLTRSLFAITTQKDTSFFFFYIHVSLLSLSKQNDVWNHPHNLRFIIPWLHLQSSIYHSSPLSHCHRRSSLPLFLPKPLACSPPWPSNHVTDLITPTPTQLRRWRQQSLPMALWHIPVIRPQPPTGGSSVHPNHCRCLPLSSPKEASCWVWSGPVGSLCSWDHLTCWAGDNCQRPGSVTFEYLPWDESTIEKGRHRAEFGCGIAKFGASWDCEIKPKGTHSWCCIRIVLQ